MLFLRKILSWITAVFLNIVKNIDIEFHRNRSISNTFSNIKSPSNPQMVNVGRF